MSRVDPGVGRPLQGGTVIPELGGSGKLLATEHMEVFTSARKEASGPMTSLPSLLPPLLDLLDAFLF